MVQPVTKVQFPWHCGHLLSLIFHNIFNNICVMGQYIIHHQLQTFESLINHNISRRKNDECQCPDALSLKMHHLGLYSLGGKMSYRKIVRLHTVSTLTQSTYRLQDCYYLVLIYNYAISAKVYIYRLLPATVLWFLLSWLHAVHEWEIIYPGAPCMWAYNYIKTMKRVAHGA